LIKGGGGGGSYATLWKGLNQKTKKNISRSMESLEGRKTRTNLPHLEGGKGKIGGSSLRAWSKEKIRLSSKGANKKGPGEASRSSKTGGTRRRTEGEL